MVCFCFSVWKWTKLWGHNFYSFSSGVFSPTATGEQNQSSYTNVCEKKLVVLKSNPRVTAIYRCNTSVCALSPS